MEYEYGLMTKADKYLVESIYNILQNARTEHLLIPIL